MPNFTETRHEGEIIIIQMASWLLSFTGVWSIVPSPDLLPVTGVRVDAPVEMCIFLMHNVSIMISVSIKLHLCLRKALGPGILHKVVTGIVEE